MKMSDKDKPVHTIPKGVWESSRPVPDQNKKNNPSTDLQGNGYPTNKQSKQALLICFG